MLPLRIWYSFEYPKSTGINDPGSSRVGSQIKKYQILGARPFGLYTESIKGDSDFWIGLKCSKGEKHGNDYDGVVDDRWEDLTEVTYTNFAPNKPEYIKSDKYKGDCIQYTSGNYTIKTQVSFVR